MTKKGCVVEAIEAAVVVGGGVEVEELEGLESLALCWESWVGGGVEVELDVEDVVEDVVV